MYLGMLRDKFPEKDIKVLQKEFLTKGEFIKNPLLEAEFKEISEIYLKIDLEGKKLYSLSS